MEGVIGYTTLFAGTYAPKNWAFCQGQLIPIQQNTALFSILGTTYGGNGTTTFALPDLRGRSVVGAGQGPGLSYYPLGAPVGTESASLQVSQMPSHTHPLVVGITPKAGAGPNAAPPTNAVYATGTATLYSASENISLNPYQGALTTSAVGSNIPFSTLHPVLGLNYVICLYGTYPARN